MLKWLVHIIFGALLEDFFYNKGKNVLTPFLDLVIISQISSGLVPPLPGSCHFFLAGGTPSRLAPSLLGRRHPHWAHAIPSGLTPTLLGWRYPFWAGATSSGLAPPVLCPSNPFWAHPTPSGLARPFWAWAIPWGSGDPTMGQKCSNRRIGGKGHSLTRPTRSAALHSTALCSALLRSAPIRSAPLRAAPLGGSFVSEKVAMY